MLFKLLHKNIVFKICLNCIVYTKLLNFYCKISKKGKY